MGVVVPDHVRLRQYIVGLMAQAVSVEALYRLPPERELCKSFKTSRPTLRKALKQLEDEGFLIRKPHFGTFVNNDMRSVVDWLTKRHKTVGLIIGGGQTTFLTPFYLELLSGLFKSAAALDANARLLSLDADSMEEIRLLLESSKFDVLVWLGLSDVQRKCAELVKAAGIPLLLISPETIRPDELCVYHDHFDAGYKTASHLLGEGHRGILFLESERGGWLERKKAGAMAAFKAAGMPWEERLWQASSPMALKDVLDKVCRSKVAFTAAAVAEPFYEAALAKFNGRSDLSVLLQRGRLDSSAKGFQLTAPAAALGERGGAMLAEILSSAAPVIPRQERIPCETANF